MSLKVLVFWCMVRDVVSAPVQMLVPNFQMYHMFPNMPFPPDSLVTNWPPHTNYMIVPINNDVSTMEMMNRRTEEAQSSQQALLSPQRDPNLQPLLHQLQSLPPLQPLDMNWPPSLNYVVLPLNDNNIPLTMNDDLFRRQNDKKTDDKDNHDENKITLSSETQESNSDEDSVTVDAEPTVMETKSQRLLVLIPNGARFSIGQIISGIPWLPIEVNVPDTIGWAWNGISSIISGIGQRLPFRPKPRPETLMQQGAIKLLVKQLEPKQHWTRSPMTPTGVVMMPLNLLMQIPNE